MGGPQVKVYVVIRSDYDYFDIKGVFANKAAAEGFAEGLYQNELESRAEFLARVRAKHNPNYTLHNNFEVEEWEVQG